MWVVDDEDARIYAYAMDGGARQQDLEFDSGTLRDAGNASPKGLWSDGATMWVTDNEDDRLYAYGMTEGYQPPQSDAGGSAANSAPEFPSSETGTRSVEENTASGQDIGAPVSASDADGDSLTYTLSGTDAGSFTLDASTGRLKTSAALDYETKTTYSVTVSVRDSKDSGGNPDTSVDGQHRRHHPRHRRGRAAGCAWRPHGKGRQLLQAERELDGPSQYGQARHRQL